MPRPRAHPEQHMMAYRLWRKGTGQTDIWDALDKKFDKPVSERTVGTWIRGFKELKPETVDLDGPFEWSRMAACRIPWQASGFIMDMFNEAYQSNGWVVENRALWEERAGIYLRGFTPTFREVMWWWRVHLAAPEIPQQVGGLVDIRYLGDFFVFREMAHELLALPLETADLQACLALKPWLNEERHNNYHKMVELGVVPPVNIETLNTMESTKGDLVREMSKDRPPELAGWLLNTGVISEEHPELLMSQQSDMETARGSGGLYSIDTGITDKNGVPIRCCCMNPKQAISRTLHFEK